MSSANLGVAQYGTYVAVQTGDKNNCISGENMCVTETQLVSVSKRGTLS